jgi:hypothetical protein
MYKKRCVDVAPVFWLATRAIFIEVRAKMFEKTPCLVFSLKRGNDPIQHQTPEYESTHNLEHFLYTLLCCTINILTTINYLNINDTTK